ncbi:alpha- and gamma-adaptin-binding protein p34-like [Babylonia areolata]|uniref:alpha- and gamma-adaptin-binding protein p34-like n=1 Tax=Babylonia areolata TaxID=304850 RepID=UPI003FD3B51C
MAAPCALIASCTSEFNPQEIVKHILNVPSLPEGCPVVESIVSYKWHIDTKYYTADVHLCTTDQRTIGDECFAESVEAFIAYFNSQEESSFQKVSSWLPYLAHINPAVQILVCQTSRQEDVVSRQTALEWCIDNGFELVELEPEENSDDEDDDFAETTGAKRIVQALHAHTWPNLTLKNKTPACSSYIRSLMQEEAALRTSAGGKPERTGNQTQQQQTPQRLHQPRRAHKRHQKQHRRTALRKNRQAKGLRPHLMHPLPTVGAQTAASLQLQRSHLGMVPDDNELAMLAALGNEDTGEESFEQLFSKLRIMKEKASTLPPDERKSYAEQIAVTFWRAIGGDEDEIEGLFDDLDPSQT